MHLLRSVYYVYDYTHVQYCCLYKYLKKENKNTTLLLMPAYMHTRGILWKWEIQYSLFLCFRTHPSLPKRSCVKPESDYGCGQSLATNALKCLMNQEERILWTDQLKNTSKCLQYRVDHTSLIESMHWRLRLKVKD